MKPRFLSAETREDIAFPGPGDRYGRAPADEAGRNKERFAARLRNPGNLRVPRQPA
jgi:hypothetical protein